MKLFILGVIVLLLPTAAFAQSAADHAGLPAVCAAGSMPAATASAGKAMSMPPAGGTADMGGPGGMKMAMPADAAHRALMAGMDDMQQQMAAGMQAPDIDVAFVCGMIPHHQGAIAMARAELRYGRDPANRRLARSIIAAQEKEVVEMLGWLKAHGGK